MAVTICEKYRILFPEKYSVQVTRDLLVFGQVELQPPLLPIAEFTEDGLQTTLVDQLTRVTEAIRILSELSDTPGGEAFHLSESMLAKVASDRNFLLDISSEITELAAVIVHIQSQLHNTKELAAKLELVRDLDQHIFVTQELFFAKYYQLSHPQLQLFKSLLNSDLSLEILELASDAKQIGVLVLGENHDLPVIDLIASKHNLTAVEIPIELQSSTPQQISTGLHKAGKDLEAELKKTHKALQDLCGENWQELVMLRDMMIVEQAVQETTADFLTSRPHMSGYLVYEGWLDPELLPVLKQRMKVISSEIVVEDTEEDANPITLLENPPAIKPFESVTELLGVPSSQEIDPSPYLAPFLIAFFGFALGDAGYGLIICTVALMLLLRPNSTPNTQNMLKLLLYGGIATVLWGIVLGGWFGANLVTIQGPIGDTLRSWKVLDLQSSILFVLLASLGVGFAQQIFGLVLQMWQFTRLGKWGRALGESGTWILLLLSILLILLSSSNAELAAVSNNWQIILLVVLVIFAWGQGSATRNPLLRLPAGIGKLFNITGYLSNTLSYARLLALGLATGVIAQVINLLANTYGNTHSVTGILVFVLILVLGHGFNLGLSILGTSVNVLRLQLVEFLPRFYQAQGRKLTPTRPDLQYTEISPAISGADPSFDLIYYTH